MTKGNMGYSFPERPKSDLEGMVLINKDKKILIRDCYVYSSEKATAPHSSILAWKIPWMEEPGRLQSMGSLRVGHN